MSSMIRSAMSSNDPINLIQNFLNSNYLYRLLELKLIHISKGKAILEFPFKDIIAIPGDAVHGGISMYILDTVSWLSASSATDAEQVLTLELKVVFINQLKGKKFTAIGEVIKSGKRVIIVDSQIMNSDKVVCVKGLGTFIPLY